MNKKELIAQIAERTGASKKAVALNTQALLEIVTETLEAGEKLQLVGFGTFETRERAARIGRNPRDAEKKIKIPAKRVPAFKAGKLLKEKVNNK